MPEVPFLSPSILIMHSKNQTFIFMSVSPRGNNGGRGGGEGDLINYP